MLFENGRVGTLEMAVQTQAIRTGLGSPLADTTELMERCLALASHPTCEHLMSNFFSTLLQT